MARYESIIGKGAPEGGRKELPIEVAQNTQFALFDRMIPEEIRPYLSGHDDDPIRSALFERWMEKYSIGFNGLTEYCDTHRFDTQFMEKAKQGNFDFEAMQDFFEHSKHGEPFFRDGEIEAFLKQYVH